MLNHKRLAIVGLVLAIFIVAIPSTTPRVYGAAAPCLQKCSITILAPGGALNSNTNVNSSFLVSFAVHNFTLQNPGTTSDVNTTTTGGGAHNEGHIHVWVDGRYITIWTSPNGIPLTLSAGSHTIRLDLVNDFHQTFSPGVNATTTVNVLESPLQATANNAQNNASNAMYYSLGALVLSLVSVILVAYVAFKPKSKP
ncbi:MAG TPA: hypothetical protein VGA05_06275 [Candidatus Bathyarchaeia archaeon]